MSFPRYRKHDGFVVIDMYEPWATCSVCGVDTPSRWGIPVSSETAEIIANDSDESCGAIPACQSCYEKHAAGEFVGDYPKF